MLTTVETERMVVRPLREEDREAFVHVHEVSRAHFGPWYPEGDPAVFFQRALEKVREGEATGRQARWVGVEPDGTLVGFFNLNEIVRGAFHSAYAAWAVSAERVGRGLATEGVTALLDLAFSARALGLHRVQANVMPENEPSLRVAEKVGMRREGTAERYLRIAGRWRDHVMFARTVEEHTFTYLV